MTDRKLFDVIIIGGSYAGLSAAMALGRSLRQTLVIDSGSPCNRQTPHSHNFLTQDGKTPKEISTIAKQQVAQYETVQFCEDLAIKGKKTQEGFEVITQTGKTFYGKKLIFATGIKDQMPLIKGFSECWGISVIHCPYCHGYEYRGRETGIMADPEKAFHLAPLVRNLTTKLTILSNGKAGFTQEQTSRLSQHNIRIVDWEVDEIEHENGQIKNVLFRNGERMKIDALYAGIPFEQHSDIPASLGCGFTEQGHISIDFFQKTTVDGVFACGDNSTWMRSVSSAVAAGTLAGAAVNKELCEELF